MSDLISREKAIEALSKNQDNGYTDIYHDGYVDGNYDAIDIIKTMPSAEPEIIRCKDCKYAHLTYNGDCKRCDKWVDEDDIPLTVYLDGGFYCGFAERRTDE